MQNCCSAKLYNGGGKGDLSQMATGESKKAQKAKDEKNVQSAAEGGREKSKRNSNRTGGKGPFPTVLFELRKRILSK